MISETTRHCLWMACAVMLCGFELALEVRFALLPPLQVVSPFVRDDAFYYLQTAYNWTHGAGITFDGQNRTNGFQPLWFLVCAAVAWCCDKSQLVSAVLIVSAVLNAGTGWILFRFGKKLSSPFWGLMAVYAWVALLRYPALNLALSGSEWSLNAFVSTAVLTLTITGVLQAPAVNIQRYLGLALAWGVPALVRIDLIPISMLAGFLLAIHALGIYAPDLKSRRWGLAAVLVVLSVLPFVLNGAIQQYVFDSALPISGRVKGNLHLEKYNGNVFDIENIREGLAHSIQAGVRQLTLPVQAVRDLTGSPWSAIENQLRQAMMALFFVPFLLPVMWSLGEGKQRERRFILVFLASLAAGVAVRVVAYSIYIRPFEEYNVWHYGFEFVFVLVVWLYIFHLLSVELRVVRLPRLPIQFVIVGLALASWASSSGANWSIIRSPMVNQSSMWVENLYRLAMRMPSLVPDGASIGSHNAGILGFYCNRRVVNLDGLINSTSFFERVMTNPEPSVRYREYCLVEGIEYYADYFDSEQVLRNFDGLRFRLVTEEHFRPERPIRLWAFETRIPIERRTIVLELHQNREWPWSLWPELAAYSAELPAWLLAGSYTGQPYGVDLTVNGKTVPYGFSRESLSGWRWLCANRRIVLLTHEAVSDGPVHATLTAPFIRGESDAGMDMTAHTTVEPYEVWDCVITPTDGTRMRIRFGSEGTAVSFPVRGLEKEQWGVVLYELVVEKGNVSLEGFPGAARRMESGPHSGWFSIQGGDPPSRFLLTTREAGTELVISRLVSIPGDYPTGSW